MMMMRVLWTKCTENENDDSDWKNVAGKRVKKRVRERARENERKRTKEMIGVNEWMNEWMNEKSSKWAYLSCQKKKKPFFWEATNVKQAVF